MAYWSNGELQQSTTPVPQFVEDEDDEEEDEEDDDLWEFLLPSRTTGNEAV